MDAGIVRGECTSSARAREHALFSLPRRDEGVSTRPSLYFSSGSIPKLLASARVREPELYTRGGGGGGGAHSTVKTA